jgi:C4-dicarboxylate transporter DctM subunit
VTTAFLFAALFVFLFMGMPIAISLGLSSVLTILFFAQDSLASLALKFFQTMENFTLLAIPFFILSGAFLTTGGVAKRLIAFATAMVGHIRGGLAMGAVLSCMLFAAISGSSPATVVAIGTIVIAGMVRAGYSKEFASGVICNAGTLGILIPPSIPMVVYAAATESSVGRLFMAGFLPGLVLGIMLMVAIYIAARVLDLPRQPRVGWGELFRSAREAIWGLLLIVVILGGIYGGIFTPTEAAAVAAVYAFIVAVWVYGDISLKEVPKVLVDAGKTSVMLMFIIANAMLFAHVLTTERIPQAISEAIVAAKMEPWLFLLVVNLILLIAGDFMEPSAIILILAPIFYPIAMQLGIDPIHFGIIIVVNMEIGMVTPPVGLNLFVTSAITGMPFWNVFKAAVPWMFVLLLFLVIVTYVPWLSLVLPNAVFGKL